VRPLLVVLDEPIIRDLLHLLDRLEDVGVEDLGSVGLVETLDEGVLLGLLGSMKRSSISPSPNRPEGLVSSVPLSGAGFGFPWSSIS
jgi:hypothetical protein